MSKLSSVIDDAADETVPVPSLLRRLKAVAYELDSASLVDWVDMEFSGYGDDEIPLPPYRGPFPVEVIAEWVGPGGSRARMPLPSARLPEAMRKPAYELVFRYQSVSELQQLAQSTDMLMHDWPANVVTRVNAMISRGEIRPEIPGGTLVRAYRQFSPALIAGMLGNIRTRALDTAISLQQVAPKPDEAPPAAPARSQPVAENREQDSGSVHAEGEPAPAGGADESSAWDVHIGYWPPQRWDALPDDKYARRALGGDRGERPALTSEVIAWGRLNMTPRWIGDDTSSAVAAIQPHNFHDRGSAEWRRFIAGTQARGQLALAISMPEEPEVVGFGVRSASVALPVAFPDVAHVGGPLIPLAKAPSIAEGLEPVDHDLASRLIEVHGPELSWWSLELTGAEMHPPGGATEWIDPIGTLSPLLISGAGEVAAAVWTSPDGAVRHYVIPRMPVWTPVLEWLSQRAIPELALSAPPQNRPKADEEKATGPDGSAAPAPTHSVAPPSASETVSEAPTRRPKSREGGRVRALAHKVLGSLWTITIVGGVIVGVLVLLIWSHIHPDPSSHQPPAPTSPNPPIHNDPPVPVSTASTTSLTSPPPLPPRPAEEQEIRPGATGEFFQGAVTIGIGETYGSWSDMTITTAKLSCTDSNLNVGQAVPIAGKNADRDDYFRITLLKAPRDIAATLRVEELPVADWSTAGDFCPH